PLKNGVNLDFSAAIARLGRKTVEERYGNLFQMYERIAGEDPYSTPMRIYPATHYTMGGLWVDYELGTTLPSLYAAGEANFSDHGANRLGASALMQGLADGYFVLPYTISNYLAPLLNKPVPSTDHPAFAQVENEARERFNTYLAV
ncbi:MAG: FAD-binding protein, partial [Actinomycetota bacterium]